MGLEYGPAIDMWMPEDWVFHDTLNTLSGNDLSIVIHKTASGGFATATDTANYFLSGSDGQHKSVHFIVGRDGSVIQMVHVRDTGKHLDDGAGGNCCLESGYDPYWQPYIDRFSNLNLCTLSIEHEDWTSDNSQTMTLEQVSASHALVLWLVQTFSIPIDHIKGHNTLDPISRAHCPGPTYDINGLITYLKGATTVQNPPPTLYQYTQEEIDSWNYTGLNLSMQTDIATAWSRAWRSGHVLGPPLGKEKNTDNGHGTPIIRQVFAHADAEYVENDTGVAEVIFYDGRGYIGGF